MEFQSFDFEHDSPCREEGFDVDLNAFEIGAAVGVAGITVASVGITTMAAPTVVAIPGIAAGAAYLAGFHQRHGHLPFMGKDEQAVAPTPVAPVAAVAPQPATVTDTSGKAVNPEDL